ncbi:MAG TPA: hypothetical protein VG965_04260 [Patescibacteria group bacterium]|nr:hypothetical protein [Patescibacteria group bacterium]
MKRYIFIFINVILACFFALLLLSSPYVAIQGDNIFRLLNIYWGNIVIFLFIVINCTTAYKLSIKTEQKNLNRYMLWTFFTIVGFFVVFVVGVALSSSEAPTGPTPEEVFRLQIIKL